MKGKTIEGQRLKKALRVTNVTQQKIAEILGTKQTFISAICVGDKNLTKGMAARIEKSLGVNAEWLLTGEGDMMLTKPAPDKPSQSLIDIKEVDDSFNDSATIRQFLNIIQEKDRQIEELNRRIRQLTDKLLGL